MKMPLSILVASCALAGCSGSNSTTSTSGATTLTATGGTVGSNGASSGTASGSSGHSSSSSGNGNGISSSGAGGSGSSAGNGSGSSSGAAGCGSVTELGQCNGAVLEYCDTQSNQLVTENCAAAAPPDAGEVLVCQLIDAAYGYDCAAPVGGNCYFVVDSMGDMYVQFCEGTNSGCVFGTYTADCQSNLGTCVGYDDDGGFVISGAAPNLPACSSNILEFQCTEDQPVGQDCTAIGGTCSNLADGGAGCVGLPAGQECDEVNYFCASGETCSNPDGGFEFCAG